jgi:hypothetical protein
MLCLLLAVAWLPMSMHCQLEAVSGLEFLACFSDGDCHGQPGSATDDAGCCLAEKSQYQAGQSRLTLPSPDLLVVSITPLLPPANLLPAEVGLAIPSTAPPPLLKTWQFVSRTALPVRAPSLAS